jgi:hypothetical protein
LGGGRFGLAGKGDLEVVKEAEEGDSEVEEEDLGGDGVGS